MTNELFEKYWANVRFCFITFLLAVILIGILSILFFRKRLPFKILLLSAISMGLITLFLVFAYAIPCAKDYEYVKKDECIEIYGRVTEFTKRKNSDGEIIYSRPKFLIAGPGANCFKDGKQVTKYIKGSKILSRTIANNTKEAITRQTSALLVHKKALIVSGIRYLAGNGFSFLVSPLIPSEGGQ